MRITEKILPPTYFITLLLLSITLNFVFSPEKVIFPPYNFLGWGLVAFGVIFNVWADSLFRDKRTTVKPFEKPTELIVSGPFRISRHPMYLGMTAILLGIAFVFGTLISFVFPAAFVALSEILFIPHEEENLEEVFGREYLSYKRRVRRWL